MQNSPDDLHRFLDALYEEHDLIEIRPIEIWHDRAGNCKRSQVVTEERTWLTPGEIIDRKQHLEEINIGRRANIFMGVNPRKCRGGRKTDVQVCHCLWADIDQITPEVASWRCEEVAIPRPSIVVDSGRGVHLYWLLVRPFVCAPREISRLERCLKTMYRLLGCDSTSDVNRLLRLPGFFNVKNLRNGATPTICELVQCDPNLRYEWNVFPMEQTSLNAASESDISYRNVTDRFAPRVEQLIRRLDIGVKDRSRRDFGIVCAMLRFGVSPQEIWQLVADHSKFATNGRSYFETTLSNARKVTGR